jgi:hypothetical protein
MRELDSRDRARKRKAEKEERDHEVLGNGGRAGVADLVEG